MPMNELYIYLNGIHVGMLSRERSEQYVLKYDAEWLGRTNARPISLSLPLTEKPIKGERVFNFFNNLLPDNDLIRERIQKRFRISGNKCFDLLMHTGKDCIGALQLLTAPLTEDIRKVDYKTLSDKRIADRLRNYRTEPLGMSPDSDFRISLAGAQEKTALLRYKGKWCLPVGATPTTHIIKLPMGRIAHSNIDLSESVENEWLCHKILSEFGLPVAQARIKVFEDVKVLTVERFDRKWSTDKSWLVRLPQEDLCQALGRASALKYESDGGPGILDVMNLLRGAAHSEENRARFMKSVFLFWVLGAIDGHAKNFSIFIGPSGRYELTPLYDVISAYPLADKREMEWKKIKMAMSLAGTRRHYRWDNVQMRYWLSTANQCYFPESDMRTIIEEVFDELELVIARVEKSLPKDFPEKIATSIFSGMRKAKQALSI